MPIPQWFALNNEFREIQHYYKGLSTPKTVVCLKQLLQLVIVGSVVGTEVSLRSLEHPPWVCIWATPQTDVPSPERRLVSAQPLLE